jgi:DSBA-like thioredoxin domain
MTLAIDVFSDVICPWCFIGKRRLEKAIAALPRGRPQLKISGIKNGEVDGGSLTSCERENTVHRILVDVGPAESGITDPAVTTHA